MVPRPGRRRLAALAVAVCAWGAASCRDEPTSAPPAPADAPRPAAPRAGPEEASQARRPTLRDDVGGWTPADDLLADAEALGDPARRAEVLARLDAGPLARKIDVLRAGLRLADDAAARACAARLHWRWIDGWECARYVDLLVPAVLLPGSDLPFDRFREALGSADLATFVERAPPLPWSESPESVLGELHRNVDGSPEGVAVWMRWMARPEPEIRGAAWSGFATTWERTDAWRDGAAPYLVPADQAASLAGPGLPPLVRKWWIDAAAWKPEDDVNPWEPDVHSLRWMFAAEPGERDADLICDAAEKSHYRSLVRGYAYRAMGKLRDARSLAMLRAVEDDDVVAWDAVAALARRGDAAAIAELAAAVADASADADDLTLLMEVDPVGARKLVERHLLGGDDEAAEETLDTLADFTVPGANESFGPRGFGYDWRRTSFAGFEAAALAKSLPVARLLRIALVVPGCRTRRMAERIAHDLRPEDLAEPLSDDAGAFLETGAPDAFRAALRRIAAAGGDPRDEALRILLQMGDPESDAALVDQVGGRPDFETLLALARTRTPAVREHLDARLIEFPQEVGALAAFHGLPEAAAWCFVPVGDEPPPLAVDAVRDGRPVDGLVIALRFAVDSLRPPADPDRERVDFSDVGAVRDPRVAEILQELRRRRDLGTYWYATGQLAAMGDPAARAEFWAAIEHGRYRIGDQWELFAYSLGDDLATVPYWIGQLRTNCCRANPAGGVLRRLIGFRDRGGVRTEYERATELWDSAGGRWTWSRIAGHYVPEPR